jgi:hypothetical protein
MKVNKPFKPIFKIYLYLRDKFNPKPIVSDEEKYAVEIAKNLIKLEDSILYISPISNKRFIRHDNKNIYVVIDLRNILIINHIYSYSVYIESDELYNTLIDFFNQTLEKKRDDFEKEIKKNIQHSLKNILDNMKPN